MTASHRWTCCLLILFLLAGEEPSRLTAAERYDVVLQGGSVHVGDGSEPKVANVGVKDGKIAAISADPLESGLILDCTGLVVCPGFIDLHNHSDNPITSKETRANVNYLLQGCTTIVTGNCGSGPIDVAKYLTEIDDGGAGTHVAHLLPQGRLRDTVIGKANRKPTDEELAKMRDLADKAMLDGAFGMTTGLIYIPGTFTETEELIEIAKIVGKHGGIYGSHIRGEGETLLAAVEEAIRIGREANTPVHISHFKASGRPNWGTLRLAAELVEKARAAGQVVTADQYPYIASSTSLEATLLPSWCREGGREDLKKRLDDPELAKRIESAVADKLKTASRIQLANCRYRPEWTGKSLDEIAEQEKRTTLEIVMDIERHGGAQVVNFGMSEDDVRMAMALPWVATASDGGAKIPTADVPHPRSFGTFPRKIGHYAVEEQVLSLPAAIRSASGLPAEILGLTDRGLLKEGLAADIAVFDPQTFRDRATFTRPDLPPSGIRHVLVEGALAVYDGQATGTLAGRALRKADSTGDVKKAAAAPANKPADWAVGKLIEEVQQGRGKGAAWSVDFDAWDEDVRDLPIGVFDSGIGGLTVLEALLTTDLHHNESGRPGPDGVPDLAGERFLYLGDQANMPYGNYAALGKEDLLREHILKDSLFLLGNRWWPAADAPQPRFDKPPVKAIVIACNTATAYGLEDLRTALEQWDVPVLTVGVVEAGANSVIDLLPRDGTPETIAVLATTGTCSSGAYPRSIQQAAGQRGRRQPPVIQQGSLALAGVIEQDPAFIQPPSKAPSTDYRGPAVDNAQAPLDLALLDAYGFDPAGLLGESDRPETWRLNSIDNYIRYDVATLVEQHRSSGATQPIRYVMLGCTHFPFEAERLRAAFLRLRDYRDDSGEQPYRPLISEQIELVDPAQLTAKELYRGLFQRMQLAPSGSEQGGGGSAHRLFVSVPAPDLDAKHMTDDGWLTHDYKYSREAGRFDREDTRIVPLRAERIPASIGALIESRCPHVWSALLAAQH